MLPPVRRRLDDIVLPPEGSSVMCDGNPSEVFRWTGTELRHYPSGEIASSWNQNWRDGIVFINCEGLGIGPPMSQSDVCGAAAAEHTSLMSSNAAIDPDKACKAAQWADKYIREHKDKLAEHHVMMASKLGASDTDPICVAACTTAGSLCGIACVLTIFGIPACEAACVAATNACILTCVIVV